MVQVLYNSRKRSEINGEIIYRLALKLEPSQWRSVSKYFNFYKAEVNGWGTTKPVDVLRVLLPLFDKNYKAIEDKILLNEKSLANANGELEAEEINGKLFNLRIEKGEIINSYLFRR